MITSAKQYHCFKCEKTLTGKCAALKSEGKLTICMPCLYDHVIIAHSSITYLSRQGWTHHTRKDDHGKLYWTYPRTMMEVGKFQDQHGRGSDEVRYCHDCKKDCGLSTQKDLVLFYCGNHDWYKPEGLLKMQCDECFTKDVGMWGSQHAGTFGNSTVNRGDATVRIYSSPEVIKYDDYLWH